MTPRPLLKLAVAALCVPALYLGADSYTGRPTLLPSAQALIGVPFTPLSFAGIARRTTRRVVAVDASMATSAAMTAGAQQSALAQQQARPPWAPAIDTVVQSLPGGCTTVPRGGVEHYDCGGVYYRTAFQHSSLV